MGLLGTARGASTLLRRSPIPEISCQTRCLARKLPRLDGLCYTPPPIRLKNEKRHVADSSQPDFKTLRECFRTLGQESVFAFWDDLDADGRVDLTTQAQSLAPHLEELIAAQKRAVRALTSPEKPGLEPVDAVVRLPEHGGDLEQRSAA